MCCWLCRYYAHNHEYLEMCRCYQAIYEGLVKSEAETSDTAMAVEGQPEWVPVSIWDLLLLSYWWNFGTLVSWWRIVFFYYHCCTNILYTWGWGGILDFEEDMLVLSSGSAWSYAIQLTEQHSWRQEVVRNPQISVRFLYIFVAFWVVKFTVSRLCHWDYWKRCFGRLGVGHAYVAWSEF